MWTFSLTKLPFPLNKDCFVKLIIPNDLTFSINNVAAYNVFAETSDFETNPYVSKGNYKVNSYSEPNGSSSITFLSCKVDSQIESTSPTGKFVISNLTTPPYAKNTGEFGFEIYSGSKEDESQIVAKLAQGAVVSALRLQKGAIKNMSLTATNPKVQANTAYNIEFTTETVL